MDKTEIDEVEDADRRFGKGCRPVFWLLILALLIGFCYLIFSVFTIKLLLRNK